MTARVEFEPLQLTSQSAEVIKEVITAARESSDSETLIRAIALVIGGEILRLNFDITGVAEDLADQLSAPELSEAIITAHQELLKRTLQEGLRKVFPGAWEAAVNQMFEEGEAHRRRYIEERRREFTSETESQ